MKNQIFMAIEKIFNLIKTNRFCEEYKYIADKTLMQSD